ncbi:MAG: hypothetical protein O3B13_14750 [Planctomycetota bacterium]|nr:hypothetical protein [Planctomycetota bacterium]MDA1164352.1 hypothetical protein [Planctomycetota bacterium]
MSRPDGGFGTPGGGASISMDADAICESMLADAIATSRLEATFSATSEDEGTAPLHRQSH